MKNKLSEIGNRSICPVAVIIKDNKVLMGLRNYSLSNHVWTIPGGKCENGESVEMALRREVQEETGIKDLSIFKYLGELSGAKEGYMTLIFVCSTRQDVGLMEPEKFSEWRWFGMEEFPDNFINLPMLGIIKKYLMEKSNLKNEQAS